MGNLNVKTLKNILWVIDVIWHDTLHYSDNDVIICGVEKKLNN
jgi:hypothetical protein